MLTNRVVTLLSVGFLGCTPATSQEGRGNATQAVAPAEPEVEPVSASAEVEEHALPPVDASVEDGTVRGCWEASLQRLRHCDGWVCEGKVLRFATDCAEVAGPSPAFCGRFPEEDALAHLRRFTDTCAGRGQPGEACLKVLRWVVAGCERHPSSPPSVEHVGSTDFRLRVGPSRQPLEYGVVEYADVVPPGFLGLEFDRVDLEPFSIDAVSFAVYQVRDDGSEIERAWERAAVRGDPMYQSAWRLTEPGNFRVEVRGIPDERLLAVRDFSVAAGAATSRSLPAGKPSVTIEIGSGSAFEEDWTPQAEVPLGLVGIRVAADGGKPLGSAPLEFNLYVDRGDGRRIAIRDLHPPEDGVLRSDIMADLPVTYSVEIVDPEQQVVLGARQFTLSRP